MRWRLIVGLAVLLTVVASVRAADAANQRRLVDATTGQPISGARITVPGHAIDARSNAEGEFELDLPPPFVIVVVLPDGTVARPIEVRDRVQVELVVEPAISEALTVTGIAPTVDTAPGAAATYLTEGELLGRGATTVVDAIERVPGAHFVSQGQAAVPSLRGLARGRTLILVDGARAGSERRAGPNASFADPLSTASVEVARGFGSVAYGSDAFGGVIAIRSRRPDPSRPFAARLAGSMAAGWPGARGEIEVSTGYGSGGVLVAFRARDYDDYRSPEGDVANSGWGDQGIRVTWVHDHGRASWFLSLARDEGRDLGRPRSDTDTVRVTSPREDSTRLTGSVDVLAAGPFRRITIEGHLGATTEVTEQDRAPAGPRPRSVERNETAFSEGQLRVKASLQRGLSHIQVGVDVHSRFGLDVTDTTETYDRDGALTVSRPAVSVDNARASSVGAFVQASRPVGSRIALAGGIRGEHVASRSSGGVFGTQSASLAATAGFAAVTARLTPRLAATAQISRGFRAPTLSDRYARGPVGRGIFEGNPDLGTETSVQLELGGTFVTGRARFAANWFRYRISELIERYEIEPARFTFRNRPAATLAGLELETQIDAGHGLAIEAAASLVRGRDADSREPIDDVPPVSASVTTRWTTGAWSTFATLAGVGGHDEAGPTEVATPGYVRVDAGGSVQLTRAIDVLVVARNLTDASYYASAGPRWVYAPGRQASVMLVLRY